MSGAVSCIDCFRHKKAADPPYTGLRFTCSGCKTEWIFDGGEFVGVHDIGEHKAHKLRKIGMVDVLIKRAHQEHDNEQSPLD